MNRCRSKLKENSFFDSKGSCHGNGIVEKYGYFVRVFYLV